MRRFAIAICIMLAGCTDADWDNALSFLPMEHGSQPPSAQPVEQDVAAAPVANEGMHSLQTSLTQADDARCHAVAMQRANDGGDMGMDDDQQKQEYDLTYANCMAWHRAHDLH